jgi:flavodoxin
MRKIFKVILAVFAVLIILFAVFAAVIFADLAAYTATGSKKLPYSGQFMGAALVLYDPGLSGNAKDIATKIGYNLQDSGYNVVLAGVKSSAAQNLTGYDIVVVGGPIYAGEPTASVKDALSNLKHDADAKFGVFGSGQGATTPEDVAAIRAAVPALQNGGALSHAIVVKIGQGEDLTQRAQDFVNDLIS